jgi:tetratricopeptide (TPR) repeat protein
VPAEVRRVLLATGRLQEAQQRLDAARRILHDLGDRASEGEVLTNLARAELALGRLEDARGHLLEALQRTEAVRSSILGPTARASYLAAEHVR